MIRSGLAGMILMLLVLCQGPVAAAITREEFREEISQVKKDLRNGHLLSALDHLTFLWESYEQWDPEGEEMVTLNFFSGQVFRESHAYSLAASFLKQAFEISSKRSGERNYHKCGAIGSVYLIGQDWENAKKWYRIGIEIAKSQPEKQNYATAYNNMGYLFLEREQPDSAISYFEKALEAWRKYPYDSLFRGSIRDNLAQSLLLKGKDQEALKWYQLNQVTYQDMRKPHSFAQAVLGEAKIRLGMGETQKVAALLSKAKAALEKAHFSKQEPLLRSWYELSLQYARQTGQSRQIRILQKDYLAFMDSTLLRERLSNDRLTAFYSAFQERSFEKERELQRLKIREKENAVNQAQRDKTRSQWLAGVIIFSLLAIGYLILRALRLRAQVLQRKVHLNEVENELLQSRLQAEALEKENLELKVSLKEQDLTNFALDASQKAAMLLQLEEELKSLKPGEHLHRQILGIIRDMKAALQSDASNQMIRENIADVNAEFRANLLKKFPELSENEVELCGMIRTGMKTKEIASLRNVTENAVKVARKRLRKKLDITSKTNLRQFLQDI